MPLLRYMVFAENNVISHQRPVMVLLHGLGGGFANWQRQIHALKAEYDVVLIELPSHGRSPVMMSEMEISYDALVDKVLEVVDHLGIQKATYVGLSLGTMVVKYIVLHHFERVDKYILAGPVGEFNFVLRSAITIVRWLLPIASLNIIIRLVVMLIMPYEISKYARELFLASAKRLPKKEFSAWCKMLTSFGDIQKSYREQMKDEPDGLYIVGEFDSFFIPMLKKDRNRVKNMVFVKDAGHVCTADKSSVVNELMISFQNTGTVDREKVGLLTSVQ